MPETEIRCLLRLSCNVCANRSDTNDADKALSSKTRASMELPLGEIRQVIRNELDFNLIAVLAETSPWIGSVVDESEPGNWCLQDVSMCSAV